MAGPYIFLGGILGLVTYLSITKRDRTDVVEDDEHARRLEVASQEV